MHAGIDGYSRTPEHLFIAHVLTIIELILFYPCSLRVLSLLVLDSEVAMYMLRHRGCGRASVHNQRIERFWRDLFQGCLVNGESSSACGINRAITIFVESWCHHQIRTAGNLCWKPFSNSIVRFGAIGEAL